MATYLKFELEDGTIVYIEATDTSRGAGGFLPSDRVKGDHPANQEAVSFDQSIDAVRKMAAAMMQNMRSGFSETPDEISINFGLKAAAEVGTLVVARGGMEANYNIALRWQKEKPDTAKKEDKQAKSTAGSEK